MIHLRERVLTRGIAAVLFLGFSINCGMAQYTQPQCTWVMNRTVEAMKSRSPQKVIPLERQYLTFCNEYMQPRELETHLENLSHHLHDDGQFQEALGVADRCLQIKSDDLSCAWVKAKALISLGRQSAAEEVIRRFADLALQLLFLKASESMGNHDSEVVGACSVD